MTDVGMSLPAPPSRLAEQYREQGFLLIPGMFDPARVAAAVTAVKEVPEWIRSQSGSRDVQRAQPLQRCPVIRDRSWLRNFYAVPELDVLLAGLFAGVIVPAPRMSEDFKLTALLVEPREAWWSTGLHRDYRDFLPGLDVAAWKERTGDYSLFNQVNVPLLPDPCLWVVPGSHLREDTEEEARFVATRGRFAQGAAPEGGPGEPDPRRAELTDALQALGAVNLRAEPGDLLLYRSNMLHCGVYEPGPARMTLHDGVYSTQWRDYVLSTGMATGTYS